jgi:flagellar hook-associated protein 3 FlgL
MIVNKSMFPLQAGFGVISKMHNQFSLLQTQLGTGNKAQTLSQMGKDLPVSLSARSRLTQIEGYMANVEQVNLRLSFYNNALTRMDKMEGEARNSAVQGQYGSNNINMATLPGLSKARFDELITMLSADVNGRHLYGGSKTDSVPVRPTEELLNGIGGRAGYATIVTERRAADLGQSGHGRLNAEIDNLAPTTVRLAEDGAHPFGLKLSTVSQVGGRVSIDTSAQKAEPAALAFTFDDANLPRVGESITLGFTLPDGTETQITLRASDEDTGAKGEFTIGGDAATTAVNFQTALLEKIQIVAEGELMGASTFAAAENFFNAAGEPVVRVAGNDPYTATTLRVATASDTVQWYNGETAAVSASNLGRLAVSGSDGNSVSVKGLEPSSLAHGFQITAASAQSSAFPPTSTLPNVAQTSGPPSSLSVRFDQLPTAGDKVVFTLTEPSGKQREVTLEAVTGRAGPGQFTIGTVTASGDAIANTTANFEQAITRAISAEATQAEGNPRQAVSAAVEDNGRVNYGMQANEMGYLRMIRSFAALSIETYPEAIAATDPNSIDLNAARARFDAMASRQASQLSEARNSERGSVEMVTMEIGVAQANLLAATERHTDYRAQLQNLLSEAETVNKEDIAMQLLSLQTRLQASYQVTSMVSQLSLVHYL